MALAPGSRLGSYEVAALIGQGGMGDVYRARDTKLDRNVALKVLESTQSWRAVMTRAFLAVVILSSSAIGCALVQQGVVSTPDMADVVISPDGTRIIYASGTPPQLYVRSTDQLESTPLLGTQNARTPFISPDGNWVGFFDGSRALQKVSIHGGPPVTIGEMPGGPPRGASWGPDDTIIFATAATSTGLWRVPAGGGEPEWLTTPRPGFFHLWPEILPSGRAVLFTIASTSASEDQRLAVLNLVTGEQPFLTRLPRLPAIPVGGSTPRYSPTGHIVYGVGDRLWATGFDLDRLEVTGYPVPVLGGVLAKRGGATDFSFSRDGTLVYVASAAARTGVPEDLERVVIGGGTERNLILVQNWFDDLQRRVPVN